MKLAAICIALIVAWMVTSASALTKPGVVNITSKHLYTRSTPAGGVAVYSLYNFRLTNRALGNAQILCNRIGGGGGPLPELARYCWGTFSIGESTLQVHGVSRDPIRYQLGVVGGTGIYNNVGGTLFVIRYTSHPLRERLTFRLTN